MTALGAGMLAHAPARVTAQFGDLPAGYIRRQSLEGIHGELGKSFFIDSGLVAPHVPAGQHLLTLSYLATVDSAFARFLTVHPEYKTKVRSSITFVRYDSLRVDNGPARPLVGAFWWVPLRASASQPAYLEVAFWSDPGSIRLQGAWPPLRNARVEFERTNDGWSFGLALSDAVIRGQCRLTGARTAAQYPLPAFATVWAADAQPALYELYTFYGHHNQPCVGEWNAEGSNPLVAALNRPVPLADLPPWVAAALETVLSDGWHARSARYRH